MNIYIGKTIGQFLPKRLRLSRSTSTASGFLLRKLLDQALVRNNASKNPATATLSTSISG